MSMKPWPLTLKAMTLASPVSLHFGGALGRDEPELLAAERVREEGQREAAEVRPAPEAGDHEVRFHSDALELPLRLEADHGLVQEDVVQDGSEAVDRRVVPPRVLEALRHRDAEGARMVRLALEQRAPDVQI